MNWSSSSPNSHFISVQEPETNRWMATIIYMTIKMTYKAQMQRAISVVPIAVIKINMGLFLSGK